MQLFPRQLNYLPAVLAGVVLTAGAVVTFVVWYYFSPSNLQVGYAPEQPVPYSHRLHVGQLGLDCRYCHASVERSQEAMIPPTQTCMGCHALVKKDSRKLAAVRSSWKTGESVEWVRVHKLPDHAFFDHSVHVQAGVGCRSCHGRVDQMEVVEIASPLSMGWCLDCHRDPGAHIRPPERVTDMMCSLAGDACESDEDCCTGACGPDSGICAELGFEVAAIAAPEHCSGCHR